jgi:hypothetical protein
MPDDGLFKNAPREVIDYFDRRGSRPIDAWTDIAPREHALQFTVARTLGYDVLDDLRAAVRMAVVNRQSFEDFKRDLIPILQQKGWWGKVEKNGEIIQLGSVRRLKIIYDTNIATAEAAGDWRRIQAVKRELPYLEYMSSVSERKRPEHLSWVGITLPVDDAWWGTHYPPNGWMCKCRVRSRAEPREGARTTAPPLQEIAWTNKKTGEVQMVPKGIDRGFDHNPGKMRDRLIGQLLTNKIQQLPSHTLRRDAVQTLRQDPVFDYIVKNDAGYDPKNLSHEGLRHQNWPIAAVPEPVQHVLETTSAIARITVATAEKQIRSRGSSGLTVRDYALIQLIVDEPDQMVREGNSVVIWKIIDGKPWKLVFKKTSLNEIFVTSFRRDTPAHIGQSNPRYKKEE